MVRLENILEEVQKYNPETDLDLVKKAYVYSAKVHQGQTRRSGEPYLVHPLEVAHILAKMHLDAPSIATGLLHDTVEDTLATLDNIEEIFGKPIARLVDGVTKLSKINFSPDTLGVNHICFSHGCIRCYFCILNKLLFIIAINWSVNLLSRFFSR